MKKFCLLLLCLLLMSTAAFAADTLPASLGSEPELVSLPAAFVHFYVPAGMDGYEGDAEAHELGFRYGCGDDTLDLTITVYDNRYQTLKDYTAFYMQHTDYTAVSEETIGDIKVQRLTKATDPNGFQIMVVAPGDESLYENADGAFAIYHLSFYCETPEGKALVEDILSTLAKDE